MTADPESLAALTMRLRQVTSRPVLNCVEFLKQRPNDDRGNYVEYMESTNCTALIDPIELDPNVRQLLSELREEAKLQSVAGHFGRGMGRGGRIAFWIKTELLLRHGIEWRTPGQMNPDIAFD